MIRRLNTRRHSSPSPAPERATVDLRSQLGSADRIVVTDNMNRELAVIDDATVIAAVMAVLDGLGDGWHQPPQGVPVAKLRINFSEGGSSRGNMGVGVTFLAAHVHGGFLKRDSDEPTGRELLKAAGIGHLWGKLSARPQGHPY